MAVIFKKCCSPYNSLTTGKVVYFFFKGVFFFLPAALQAAICQAVVKTLRLPSGRGLFWHRLSANIKPPCVKVAMFEAVLKAALERQLPPTHPAAALLSLLYIFYHPSQLRYHANDICLSLTPQRAADALQPFSQETKITQGRAGMRAQPSPPAEVLAL